MAAPLALPVILFLILEQNENKSLLKTIVKALFKHGIHDVMVPNTLFGVINYNPGLNAIIVQRTEKYILGKSSIK
jgi:hypothetical protein